MTKFDELLCEKVHPSERGCFICNCAVNTDVKGQGWFSFQSRREAKSEHWFSDFEYWVLSRPSEYRNIQNFDKFAEIATTCCNRIYTECVLSAVLLSRSLCLRGDYAKHIISRDHFLALASKEPDPEKLSAALYARIP